MNQAAFPPFGSDSSNPITLFLDLLDRLGQMTFQEYLIGIAVIMGVIVVWGLFSMIYLAIWPDLPGPSSDMPSQREINEQRAREQEA